MKKVTCWLEWPLKDEEHIERKEYLRIHTSKKKWKLLIFVFSWSTGGFTASTSYFFSCSSFLKKSQKLEEKDFSKFNLKLLFFVSHKIEILLFHSLNVKMKFQLISFSLLNMYTYIYNIYTQSCKPLRFLLTTKFNSKFWII